MFVLGEQALIFLSATTRKAVIRPYPAISAMLFSPDYGQLAETTIIADKKIEAVAVFVIEEDVLPGIASQDNVV